MGLERSSMIWYTPSDPAAHARKLYANGCEQVWIKAGVDNPGLRTVWGQWSGSAAQAYADNGVEPLAWYYIYPENPEVQWDTIKRSLLARPSRMICLNAEVEWDDYDEAFVGDWLRGLSAQLALVGVHPDAIGFSSVPSWDKGVGGQGSPYHAFPYEAFCHACDFSMPQAYFLAPDQIVFENRRNDTNKPVIPTLWAVGDPNADPPGFTDEQLVGYARQCVATCENFAGFSSWRSELDTYQYAAMRDAYALMPEVSTAVDTPAEVIKGGIPNNAVFGPYCKHLGGGFRKTFEDAGAAALGLYGYPITEELSENGLTVQYFERARMEYNPQTGAITFGRIGAELARLRGLSEAA